VGTSLVPGVSVALCTAFWSLLRGLAASPLVIHTVTTAGVHCTYSQGVATVWVRRYIDRLLTCMNITCPRPADVPSIETNALPLKAASVSEADAKLWSCGHEVSVRTVDDTERMSAAPPSPTVSRLCSPNHPKTRSQVSSKSDEK